MTKVAHQSLSLVAVIGQPLALIEYPRAL